MPTKQIDALDNAQALGWADTQITRDEAGAVSVGTAKVVAVEDGGTLAPGLSAATVRTSLGLGTGDSPTFANAEVGTNLDLLGSDPLTAITTNFRHVATGSGNSMSSALIGNSSGVAFRSTGAVKWSNSSGNGNPDTATFDTLLYRDAAGTIAQRNGLNAQAFHIYNTYTDASNYERGVMKWDANALKISTEAAGTGTSRSLQLFSNTFFSNNNINVTGQIQVGGGVVGTGNGSNALIVGATGGARIDILRPQATLTPAANGDLCIEATNDTTLTFKLKGSDGTVRSGTVTLA